MNAVFADTAHWIALASPDDALHETAMRQMLAIGAPGRHQSDEFHCPLVKAMSLPLSPSL